MSDWAPGDLALCVVDDGGPGFTIPLVCAGSINVVDAVYVDVLIGPAPYGDATFGFDLNGHYSPSETYSGNRFIKITPEEADEFDREIIALMNSEPILTETGHSPATPSCAVSDSRRSFPSGAPAAPVSILLHGPSDSVEAQRDHG